MIQVSPHLYITPCDPDTDRPVLGLAVGEKFSVCLDAGNSPQHHNDFLTEVQKQGLPLPSLCLITHWHWDHTYGMCALRCPSVAGVATNLKLQQMADWKWDDTSMKTRVQTGEDVQFCDDHIRVEYPDRSKIKVVPADITFNGSLTLDLGGVNLQAFPLNSPHTEDCIAFLVDDILFMGDALSPKILGEDWVVFPHLHRALIQQLNSIQFNTAVWGHGDPIPKQELLQTLIDDLKNTEQ